MNHGTRHFLSLSLSLSLCKMMEEGEASMARAEGRAAIENEPKTLSFHQIKLAREAALYVVNTSTMEEALRIFTEGLQPVTCCGNRRDQEEERNDDNHDGESRLLSPRDAVSAPF
ncbi:uncharacterized protein LOC125316061 [Rhodamnia argentea]|uniref:Uncharacterized protein LOC125316061 n=1 Tax=Rhodamnia argentea TaxID=178133 RepID=A0ABM3HQY1_9MYRT|nr:uncharacterized protein LOC125316061 [Rhodamnia argentea]